MTKPVIIEYTRDVPAKEGRRAFAKGERYSLLSLEAARRYHPDAKVLGYEGENGAVDPLPEPKTEDAPKKAPAQTKAAARKSVVSTVSKVAEKSAAPTTETAAEKADAKAAD